VVWALITGNVTMSDAVSMFDAAHANLSTGALAVAGLSAARTVLRKQLLNLQASHLIVPAALETTAQTLTAAINPTTAGGVNPFASAFSSVTAEPRLDVISAIIYYLACDPDLCDTLLYGYLQGEGDGPRIETRQGFDTDGFEIRAMHDFGAVAADWRGMVKSDGTAP